MTKAGAPRTQAAMDYYRKCRELERALSFAELEAMAMPEPNSGCLLWLGKISPKGYARSKGGQSAFKLAYEAVHGSIDVDLELDHLCRVRCCINPRHLEPVTHLENLARGAGILSRFDRRNALLRAKTHCPQGHPYSGDNLYTYQDGRRACRRCLADNSRRVRAKKRGQSK